MSIERLINTVEVEEVDPPGNRKEKERAPDKTPIDGSAGGAAALCCPLPRSGFTSRYS